MNTELIDQFIDYYWLSTGASKNTLAAYRSDLKIFNKWLAGKSFISVNSKHIQDYFSDRQKNNISSSSQARILTCLHSFYQYLSANQLIKKDPTEQLSQPKLEKKLPVFLNIQEVEKLLEAPSSSSLFGQRDRAMLELLYSCGLRVSELINLSYHNINLKEEFIRIHGKGNKERVLPMGEIAIDYLMKYETNARPMLLKNGQSDSYFLSNRGSGLGVRLSVQTTGCSGLGYNMEFVDAVNGDDTLFEDKGVQLIIDAKSLIYIDGTEVDYQKDGLNEGFEFNNPNSKAECGCGESFTV